jgi:flagellar biogenesis protein FliO
MTEISVFFTAFAALLAILALILALRWHPLP